MKFTSVKFLSAFVVAVIVIHGPKPGVGDDIGTNFFLKASKSVPRIGRRSMDLDNHFLKASKSVPRIGRRGMLNEFGQIQDVKGYPIVRNAGPEVYLTETGQPLWGDLETYSRSHNLRKPPEDSEANEPYWLRVKKDSQLEQLPLEQEIF